MEEVLKDKVGEVLKTLTYREREVIKLLYGVGDGYTYTLEEVGRIFKLTKQRIQQIQRKALRKLQHPVRARKLEGVYDALAPEHLLTPQGRLLQRVLGFSASRWPPSLFHYATSERCQDAFVSWLIAWADEVHLKANGPLHRTGVYFLSRLLGLHGIDPPAQYEYVKIQKYKRIDILVTFNSEFVLLIEDKIDFIEHSNQLGRYLEIVRKDFKGLTPVPVYLKTGDQPDYSEIEKAGWECFRRKHFLEVLDYGKQVGVESDIFRDFHLRLRQMDV
jgi:hypothetical protein